MEEDCANVIQMAIQSEKASSCLIRPDLDLVIITSRDEEWLCLMKVDTSNGSVMFFESVDQSSHTIIPQLYSRRMQRN